MDTLSPLGDFSFLKDLLFMLLVPLGLFFMILFVLVLKYHPTNPPAVVLVSDILITVRIQLANHVC